MRRFWLHREGYAQDIGEEDELTAEMPDKAVALAENLDTYLVQVDAQLPSSNPENDPSTAE